MQLAGLRGDRVSQVRGFADQRLRNSKDALDPSNRSIIVQYIDTRADEGAAATEDAKEAKQEKRPRMRRQNPQLLATKRRKKRLATRASQEDCFSF